VNRADFVTVRSDPQRFCDWVTAERIVAGVEMTVLLNGPAVTILDVIFEPPTVAALSDYPVEQVRVNVFADRQVVTVPVGGSERTWMHRYPVDLSAVSTGEWLFAMGGLCLWYPKDPPHLQWRWSNGLDDYLRIVRRHLHFEEYCRRNRRPWPVEDAPHGSPTGGAHPVLSRDLRRSA
jgi:hypothetical protein